MASLTMLAAATAFAQGGVRCGLCRSNRFACACPACALGARILGGESLVCTPLYMHRPIVASAKEQQTTFATFVTRLAIHFGMVPCRLGVSVAQHLEPCLLTTQQGHGSCPLTLTTAVPDWVQLLLTNGAQHSTASWMCWNEGRHPLMVHLTVEHLAP